MAGIFQKVDIDFSHRKSALSKQYVRSEDALHAPGLSRTYCDK